MHQDLYNKIRRGAAARCPHCDQLCKIYKRKLNSQMAIFLIVLVRRVGLTGKWLRLKEITKSAPGGKNSTDGTYLTNWGLIQRAKGQRGFYRPTALGKQFVEGGCRVPMYIYLYNNEKMFDSKKETTGIHEALGNAFNYDELMHPEEVQEELL